jgi:hypothetical protein
VSPINIDRGRRNVVGEELKATALPAGAEVEVLWQQAHDMNQGVTYVLVVPHSAIDISNPFGS